MTYIRNRLKFFLYMGLGACLILTDPAALAQKGLEAPVLIRDTEIETTLKSWLAPLMEAAGVPADSVKLIIVQDTKINAFVAGGSNIFIYTGLIDKTENPGEIVGVLAHELGHIAGGHLIAMRQAFERASYESILGTVIGIGAAVATGDGGAAQAVIMGSGSMATRGFLAHTRVQESSADQAALRFLNTAQINPHGLVTFLQKLESEELLPADQQSEYMRTHPLSRDRVDAAFVKAEQSPYAQAPYPAAWTEEHARMKAKLLSFINPGRVIWTYDDRDMSVAARYARAIAAYRENRVDDALKKADELVALEPGNPYFQELKGQMLVDFGRVKEALPYYRKAVDTLPNAGLLRIDLAHALMESGGGSENLHQAVDHLERALRDEPRSGRARRLLATAYGQLGQEDLARLNLAEEAVLQKNFPYAKNQAESVLKTAENGSRAWRQAKDILEFIDQADTAEN